MIKNILILLCFLPFTAYCMEQSEIVDLFSQSKEYFRQAVKIAPSQPEEAKKLYQQAAMRLERIVQEGKLRNGKLFYNLGNIYFRMENIGKAIVNYRKAQYYIPNDPNLQQNLAYARKKRIDRVEEKPQTQALKILFFWHYDFSAQFRMIAFVFCFTMLWFLASLRLFYRKNFLFWGIAFFSFLSFALFASLFSGYVYEKTTYPGVIIEKEVIARKGDGETYSPSFEQPLHAGTEFILIEDRKEWKYIELSDGRTCWLPASSVEIINLLY